MININRSVNYLTCSRICPRGSHPVSDTDRGIADTTVFQVIRVKFGVVCREITTNHHVFQTDFFKCLVPFPNPGMHGSFPIFRKPVVHVKHDRFYRLHQFTPLVGFHIFRLHTPTVHQKSISGTVCFRCHIFFHGIEKPYPWIGQSPAHKIFLREQDHRTVHFYRYGSFYTLPRYR